MFSMCSISSFCRGSSLDWIVGILRVSGEVGIAWLSFSIRVFLRARVSSIFCLLFSLYL